MPVRITGDGATDHICYSANITSGDFFNSVAGFFRFDSTIIIISGDGATDHFFWGAWYFVMLYFVLSSAIVIQPQNPMDFV